MNAVLKVSRLRAKSIQPSGRACDARKQTPKTSKAITDARASAIECSPSKSTPSAKKAKVVVRNAVHALSSSSSQSDSAKNGLRLGAELIAPQSQPFQSRAMRELRESVRSDVRGDLQKPAIGVAPNSADLHLRASSQEPVTALSPQNEANGEARAHSSDVEAKARSHECQMALASHPSSSDRSAITETPSAGRASPSDRTQTIDAIRELHRQRQDFHRAEKSLTLQIKAICRRLCKGDKDEADVLFAALTGKGEHTSAWMASNQLQPFFEARRLMGERRAVIEDQLEKCAKQLPCLDWVKDVRGFGLGSLAALIGEAGDLALYSTHSKLWKRLGLAPFGDRALSTWRMKGGLSKAEWEDAGYSPSRRSIVWNIGACVLKSQSARIDKETGELKREAGPYRLIYDARKEYELARGIPKGHAHNRATRYMGKRLVRDLWRAWRKEIQS